MMHLYIPSLARMCLIKLDISPMSRSRLPVPNPSYCPDQAIWILQ
jgi:hypothetical protein